jgi:hypothetical protein
MHALPMHPLESRLYLTHCLLCGTLLGVYQAQALLGGAAIGALMGLLLGLVWLFALAGDGGGALYVLVLHAALFALAGVLVAAWHHARVAAEAAARAAAQAQ